MDRPIVIAPLLGSLLACGGSTSEDPWAGSSTSGTAGGTSGGTTSETTSGSGTGGGADTDGGATSGPSTGGASSGAGSSGGTPGTGGSATDGGGSGSDDGGILYDVGVGTDGVTSGCKKIDFLFVVDNSGSMQDEQDSLIAAFPDFLNTIQSTLQAQDYHIMVTDTDAVVDGGNCNGAQPSCCDGPCANDPYKLCQGNVCPGVDACIAELGAGKRESPALADCGVAGGRRYIVDGQPDLDDTFACIASVGTNGEGTEVPMASMSEAIGPLNQAGECNEAFLRDDAVLVVTFITDQDEAYSPGGPQDWYDAVVAAKGGDPTAAVVLGLIGDTDQPGALCQPLMGVQGAQASPRLRAFVDLFGARGTWGSICSPNFGNFFEQAVSVIDTTCDDFVPPG